MPTVDLARARAFYTGVLGLTLGFADDFAVVLSSGETEVRVTAVPAFTPHPFTTLGWTVDDIAEVVTRLVDRGIELVRYDGLDQDDNGLWSAPGGALVAWFRDPDGNTLSLTQPA